MATLLALLIIVILIGLLYLVRAPLLRLAGNYWIKSDPPANVDAIVILSDDNFDADRATRAADLYHDGWAPRVVGSGRRLRPYMSIADLMARDLEMRGVPKRAVIPFAHDAPDTLEELKDIRKFVDQHGWKRVMIVTSNYHTRRTRYLCKHIFPPEVHVLVVAAPDHDYDPDSWWRTRLGLKIFVHEFMGMFVAIWEVHHQKGDGKSATRLPKPAQGGVVSYDTTTRICAWFTCAGVCTIVLEPLASSVGHRFEARSSHRVGGLHVAETA